MTSQERTAIEGLTDKVSELAAEIRGLREGTSERINAIERMCNERHGTNKTRIDALSEHDRESFGFRKRMEGIVAPVALIIAAVAIIVNLFA
jgi:hypothetical protein